MSGDPTNIVMESRPFASAPFHFVAVKDTQHRILKGRHVKISGCLFIAGRMGCGNTGVLHPPASPTLTTLKRRDLQEGGLVADMPCLIGE